MEVAAHLGGCTGKGCMGRGCMGRGASPPRTPRGSWLMLLPLPFRLERSLQPGRSRGVTGEGVRIARGVLQAQIPRPAREVSCCWLCPVPQPQNPVLGALQPLGRRSRCHPQGCSPQREGAGSRLHQALALLPHLLGASSSLQRQLLISVPPPAVKIPQRSGERSLALCLQSPRMGFGCCRGAPAPPGLSARGQGYRFPFGNHGEQTTEQTRHTRS